MMVSLQVSLGMLSALFFVASAEEMWQAIPSCAKAFMWSKEAPNYWEDTLKPIYDRKANDHKRQFSAVLQQAHLDYDYGGTEPFRKCVYKPSSSNMKFFSVIAECRDKTLSSSMKEDVKKAINDHADDGKKALEATKRNLTKIYCGRSRSECARVGKFVKCTEDETKGRQ